MATVTADRVDRWPRQGRPDNRPTTATATYDPTMATVTADYGDRRPRHGRPDNRPTTATGPTQPTGPT
ncbi:hypothetical protein ACIO53_22355 [Streptomyces sp. NPDC087305]|uniref:hypothetical protein n=1 Tax=Streptomyces sp. NPDC087305 TaxID=3365781 RepID=UPI0037F6E8DA